MGEYALLLHLELLPTLLCVEKEALEAAMQLFDPPQLGALVEDGRALLEGLERGGRLPAVARERLALMEQALSR